MSKVAQYIHAFFEPLNTAQRLLFGLFSAAIIAGLSFLFYWAMQPSYTILFSSLPSESAQTIVEELNSMGVPYKLENGGNTIMVPRSNVYNLRLQFAAEGEAGMSYEGYEIFDNNTLGMTDFMQRVNKKRALEGELARTINSLTQVASTRIHLVLPERTPFQQTTVEPSASVILDLKGNYNLSQGQVRSIATLVAGSVEGLNPDKVIILDEDGNRLTENMQADSDLAMASNKIAIRKKTETYLMHKGQTMLNQVLGPGNSILRLSTQHDFDRLVRESNLIEPDSRVIISEEEQTETNENVDSEPVEVDQFTPIGQRDEAIVVSEENNETSTTVRNYQFNRINERYEKASGAITRITASVLVDYKAVVTDNPDGTTTVRQVPHTAQEIREIEEIMNNVLGINAGRGDRLTVTQIKFQEPLPPPEDGLFFLQDYLSYQQLFRWILLAAALTTVLLIVYRMTRRVNTDLVPMNLGYKAEVLDDEASKESQSDQEGRYIAGSGDEDVAADFYKDKLSLDAQKQIEARNAISEEIINFVQNNGKEAANVVRSMMSTDRHIAAQNTEEPAPAREDNNDTVSDSEEDSDTTQGGKAEQEAGPEETEADEETKTVDA